MEADLLLFGAVAMFYRSVVLKERRVVDGRLDAQGNAVLVIHLNRNWAMLVF